MRIGVVSDTHIPASARELPPKLVENLTKCDIIVHAGDLVEEKVLEKFKEIAQTKAVWGNMDPAEVRKVLPEKIVFEAGGMKIGVVHGKGSATMSLEAAKEAFKGENLNIIIFGHSHKPFNQVIDGTLYFNPGSACDRIFAPYCSFGIIEIEGEKIKAEIVKLED